MNLKIVAQFVINNPIISVAIGSASIAFFGTIFSLVEYYRLKARWDFYFVDNIARRGMRSGFHPEYLTYGFIVSTIILAISGFNLNPLIEHNFLSNFVKSMMIISFIIYIIAFFISYFFNRPDMRDSKLWLMGEYIKARLIDAGYVTFKYAVLYTLSAYSFFLFYKTHNLLIPIISVFLILFSLFQMEYYFTKIRINSNTKWLKIKIAFTMIDGCSRSAYTMYKLQGIPKTENLTEPDNRNRKSTTEQDTSKAIYYIQRKS